MRCVILDDYPGYIIYEDGRIFANTTKKVWLRQAMTLDGYRQVNVITKLARNGYRHSVKTHRLVAMAFVPNPFGYREVNHIDGNKLNNHYTNLEWCSRSHNVRHSYSTGLRSGDAVRQKSRKISDDEIIAIRESYSSGLFFQKQIAEKYGITQAHVSSIVLKKCWSDV